MCACVYARVYIYYTGVYYRGLAHVIIEAAMFMSAVWPPAQDPGEPVVQVKSKVSHWLCTSPAGGRGGREARLSVLFWPSTGQTRPTHIMESDLPIQSSQIQCQLLPSCHIKLTVTVHKGGHSGFRGVCLKFSSAAALLLQSIPAHLPGAFPASPASSYLCFGMLSTQSSPASRPDEESCLLVDPRGLTVHGGHAVNAG